MSAPLALLALAVTFSVSGCGGSSSSDTSTTGAGRGGFFQSATVRACLKKQGVALPSFPRNGARRRPGGFGGPRTGTTPTRAPRGRFGGPGSARFAKLRKALRTCGVSFRGGPGGPPGQGAPPAGAPTS
jgi:hypothetical protein